MPGRYPEPTYAPAPTSRTVTGPPTGGLRRSVLSRRSPAVVVAGLAVALMTALVMALAVALTVGLVSFGAANGGRDLGDGASSHSSTNTSNAASTTSPSPATSRTTPRPDTIGGVIAAGQGGDLAGAACDEKLLASMSVPVLDSGLVEVSGVAVDDAGTVWVVNDSGDSARLFAIRSGTDGKPTVQTVTVDGAENVDWEDMVLARGPGGPILVLADTGDNRIARASVTLYRVAVPLGDSTSVAAEPIVVAYPDGAHDVEAVVADVDGSVLLMTKEPGRSRVYRVSQATSRPPSQAAVVAEAVGVFPVGSGETSMHTAADLSGDGSVMVLRTYGSVFVVSVPAGQTVMGALGDETRRCRGVSPLEVQGEAIALLPGADGYVTVGEGSRPRVTTVVAPKP